MWSISFTDDPLGESISLQVPSQKRSAGIEVTGEQVVENVCDLTTFTSCESVIVKANANIKELITSMHENDTYHAFEEGGRAARTTLAHLFSSSIADSCPHHYYHHHGTDKRNNDNDNHSLLFTIEPLYFMRKWKKIRQLKLRSRIIFENIETQTNVKVSKKQFNNSSRNNNNNSKKKKPSSILPPYIMERTDVWCDDNNIHITLAVMIDRQTDTSSGDSVSSNTNTILQKFMMEYLEYISSKIINGNNNNEDDNTTNNKNSFLSHIANTVLQTKLRNLLPSLNAVAFIADGSIMPRKSGVSFAPMSSPPAIPFIAPNNNNTNLAKIVNVPMGKLVSYVTNPNITKSNDNSNDNVTISGMIIPKGITLIVGGGYHGKSTMLRTIMSGVYDKILGDGRELCVTDSKAISVRAEDGRYVNNTNVSAFISNLPIVGSDTKHFSSREASGSTSQAANVADAIEMGASAMLVDEDVSAANFMSRDGRMRSLVMDESITPLLYRVNGLFDKHGISSVVVVGGVGDWLDVPNAVIRLEKYVASDALEKAKSISRQFSHGHVQYGGRGVVHRLEWDSRGTPFRRRPTNGNSLIDLNKVMISLLDGGGKLSLAQWSSGESNMEDLSYNVYGNDYSDVDDINMNINMDVDEDTGTIDMARCEQLTGKYQLYACAICAIWMLKAANSYPELDMNQLLDKLEATLDGPKSFEGILDSISSSSSNVRSVSNSLLTTLGYVIRPRRYEVMMTLTRMRGIEFEELPPDKDILAEITAKEQEEEEKKRMLAELWANRRKKNRW